MTSYHRRAQILAACLAALAGYVDAIGFLATGGFFVSFMSGNSTRMGIGLTQENPAGAIAAGLIGAFLFGVIVGALAGNAAGRWRRTFVLILVTMGLTGGAALSATGETHFGVLSLAFAMGAENNMFERNGEVSLGVTYMTGGLVKLGQRIAAALQGRELFGWVSYLALWLSFVAGVVAGALLYPRLELTGLWIAAGVAASFAVVSLILDLQRKPRVAGSVLTPLVNDRT